LGQTHAYAWYAANSGAQQIQQCPEVHQGAIADSVQKEGISEDIHLAQRA